MSDEAASYIAENYGRCALDAGCLCLRRRWLGRACPHWQPCEAKDFADLAKIMRDRRDTL